MINWAKKKYWNLKQGESGQSRIGEFRQQKEKNIEISNKVKVVEREQQIAIQQQEIQRKEKELNSKVRYFSFGIFKVSFKDLN